MTVYRTYGQGSPPHPRGIFTDEDFGYTLDEVHPRIRGEYFQSIAVRKYYTGSPPHPRGILKLSYGYTVSIRFTPASAGNIRPDSLICNIPWVHPRIRREYRLSTSITPSQIGSPPHPRGIFWLLLYCSNILRFTPASAGNIHLWYKLFDHL